MNIAMGFLFTAFLALAMTLENAIADDTLLLPGSSLTVVCSGGGVPVVTPPSPPFAAPVPCEPPNPRIGMTDKLNRLED